MLFSSLILSGGIALANSDTASETTQASKQSEDCKGVVLDQAGLPVAGASVLIKGTQTGVVTDTEGQFSLPGIDQGTTLSVICLGYVTVDVVYQGQELKVVLREDRIMLDNVVVTAMGIKRSEKSLAYATQKIDGDEFSRIPSANMLNNLAGKVAGMTVSNSTSGVGGSVKVLLRGNRSINGNNQPLYVVDGTPINSNPITEGSDSEGGYGGNIDAGDGLAGIAAEDIESMNVLKGAAAAALYGSQAANGVIIINTKRGKAGRAEINFTTGAQFDAPYTTYKFNDKFLMGNMGNKEMANAQWGPEGAVNNDYIDDFFKTGQLYTNRLAVSGGNDMMKNYLSYQNTYGKGIMPANTMNRHNLGLRTNLRLFDGVIEVDGNVALTKQKMDHAPAAPGRYFNPIVGLYLFPEGTEEFNKFRDQYEVMNMDRNIMHQNWSHESDISKNPYWLTNRHNYSYDMDKIIAKVNLTVNFTDWLNLKLRGSYDQTNGLGTRKCYYGASVITSDGDTGGGRYETYRTMNSTEYADALLNFDKKVNDFHILATIGGSYTHNMMKSDGNRITLKYPNFFHMNNFIDRPIHQNEQQERTLAAVFGTVSLGWKDMLFLDITARNDWSSTLPKKHRSFFYPSVGASWVFTELLDNPMDSWLNFGKVRLSWTQVGNDMPWGKTIVYDSLNDAGDIQANVVAPFTDLKPEKSTAWEAGLQMNMFDGRFSLDLAFYNTDTENQYFLVDNTTGTGYEKYFINAGKIRNMGFEATIGFTPVRTRNFEWNGSLNLATNKNVVKSLPEQYAKDGLIISGSKSAEFMYKLYEGQEWGGLYVKSVKRDDQGRVIVTETEDGQQLLQNVDDKRYVGNVNPKLTLGFTNTFRYRDFLLSFQIDARIGGKAMSLTQGFLNETGRSAESMNARLNGGIVVPAVTPDGQPYDKPIDAEVWYKSNEGKAAIYSATNVRMREISFGYSLPKKLLDRQKVLKGVTLSFVMHNAFFFYRDAPFDPEMVLSTSSNSLANLDNFSIPMSRNMGFTLNLKF